MKAKEKWLASKFVYRRGRLAASRDPQSLSISSRLSAGCIAAAYDAQLKRYASGELLDLGCGKVPLYEAYRDLVVDVTCVDWAGSVHKNEHLDFEWDLSVRLPFRSEMFDTIILSDVLEHIPNPDLLWGEMSRVLTKGGRLILNVPYMYWLHEQPHDFYRYTEFALRRFAENSSMRVLELFALGGVIEVLADILAKSALSIPYLGVPCAITFQNLARLFSGTSVGMRVARRSSKRMPLGYFLVAEKVA